jgi:hypothetical protein
MMAKPISAWLICLALVPFTAPFATCDLTIFLAGPAPAHGTCETKALADRSLSPTLPFLFRASGRVRSIALSQFKPAGDASPHLAAATPESLPPIGPTTPRHDVTILRI